MKLRRVEVFKENDWMITRLKELVEGDVFRMFDDDDPVKDKDGDEEWEVKDSPVQLKNKIWSVTTKSKGE